MAQFFPDCVIHAFLLLLKPSRIFFINQHGEIFSCILLTGKFFQQYIINRQIFSKTTNCTRPTGSCNFVNLKKFTRAYLFQIAQEKSFDYLYKLNSLRENGGTPLPFIKFNLEYFNISVLYEKKRGFYFFNFSGGKLVLSILWSTYNFVFLETYGNT